MKCPQCKQHLDPRLVVVQGKSDSLALKILCPHCKSMYKAEVTKEDFDIVLEK